MPMNQIRAAIHSNDLPTIAKFVREVRANGGSDRSIYRFALAVDPTLDYDTWTDTVKTALEKNP